MNFKIIALILILVLVVFISSYSHSQLRSDEITNSDIEKYGNEYLKNYNSKVEKLDRKYWDYFSFYKNGPYKFIGYISSVQGSAIKFVPNDNKGFEIIHTDKEINDYFIDSKNKADIFVIDSTNQGYQGTYITNGSIVANGTGIRLIKVYENTSAFFHLIKFCPEDENSRYINFDYIYFKSKSKNVWTLEQARRDSSLHFMNEFWHLFNSSEEFRQYIAIPELKDMIDNINYKRLNNLYPSFVDFKEDLNVLIEVGKTKYNLSSDFVEEMYKYEFENTAVEKKWYDHPILIIFTLVFGSVLEFLKIIHIREFVSKYFRQK